MAHLYHFTSEEGYAALIDNAATLYASGVPRGRIGQPTDLAGNRLPTGPRAPQVTFGTAVVGYMSLLIALPSPDGKVHFVKGFDADADYGIGWYVTDLEPKSGNEDILRSLWQGDPAYLARTGHWLQLAVDETRAVTPDTTRPYVKFVPLCTGLDFIGDPLACRFTSTRPIYLVSAGTRTQRSVGDVAVCEQLRPGSPAELVPAYDIRIEHFAQLSRIQQASVLRGVAPRAVGDRDSFALFCEHHPTAVGGLVPGVEKNRVKIVASFAVR